MAYPNLSSQDPSICAWSQNEACLVRIKKHFDVSPPTPALADQTVRADQITTSGVSSADESAAALESDDRPFPLMKLPLELRNEIYKQHLVILGVVSIKYARVVIEVGSGCGLHTPPHFRHTQFDKAALELFATSKTIYAESAPVFFRYNLFRFIDCDTLTSFLSHIGPTSRRNITSISFIYDGNAPAQGAKALRECVGLRRLRIETYYYTNHLVDCRYRRFERKSSDVNLMKLRGLTDLLKIRGIEEIYATYLSPAPEWPQTLDSMPAFKEALQVLKQPHQAAQLTRQEKKDYPTHSQRTVYGKANVKTRSERKLIASQPPASD